MMGIKTGFNDAFLIDTPTKNALINSDPRCADIIKPYVRGQDINRWHADWAGLWMIALKSSGDHTWPWAEADEKAEAIFAKTYPSLYAHMSQYREQLVKRQDQGRYWWELRACAYWADFSKPKIMYQEIQFHPCYAVDCAGTLGNNKTFFIASDDSYLLAVLNSPLMWWHNWRYLPHMKDEALTPVAFLLESLPIAVPADKLRREVAASVRRVVAITQKQGEVRGQVLDWLGLEHEIAKPNQKLTELLALDEDAFLAEVKKVRGKGKSLTVAAVRSLRDAHAKSVEPARRLVREAAELERQISDLVNEAYGLTPDEVNLMWKTAPPRMPGGAGG